MGLATGTPCCDCRPRIICVGTGLPDSDIEPAQVFEYSANLAAQRINWTQVSFEFEFESASVRSFYIIRVQGATTSLDYLIRRETNGDIFSQGSNLIISQIVGESMNANDTFKIVVKRRDMTEVDNFDMEVYRNGTLIRSENDTFGTKQVESLSCDFEFLVLSSTTSNHTALIEYSA